MNNRIVTSNKSALPIIGKIKIGKKVPTAKGFERPVSTDYFIPTGKFADVFTKVFGEKPDKIKIIFPSNESVKQYYELRDKELYATSDGLSVRYSEGGEWHERRFETVQDCEKFRVEYEKKLDKKDVRWRKKLEMDFLIPEIKMLGVWRFETHGEKSMVEQIANMFDICANTFIVIPYVPFWFTVEAKEHRVHGLTRKFNVATITAAIGVQKFNEILETSDNPVYEIIKENTSEKIKSISAPAPEPVESVKIEKITAQPETTGKIFGKKSFEQIHELAVNKQFDKIKEILKFFQTPPNVISYEHVEAIENLLK